MSEKSECGKREAQALEIREEKEAEEFKARKREDEELKG